MKILLLQIILRGFITKNALIEQGMTDKEASSYAEKLRDFYSAYYSGDEETMDKIAGQLSGTEKKWDLTELRDTIASTTLLTGVTGLPGTVTTTSRGAAIRNELGDEGVRSLVNFAGDWDPAAIISQYSPIKTNAAGWASYTAFTDVYLKGEDVKAYTAIQINKNSVLLKTIDDKVIPAGTAVFVKGAEKTAYNVNGALVGGAIGKNYLKPVLFDTPLTSGKNAFVIGTRDGVCGLYLVNSNIVVPAGKCYLDAGEASLVLAKDELQFVFYDSERQWL